MSHICNLETTICNFDFLLQTLKQSKIEFKVEKINKRTTVILEKCHIIQQGAFIWNGKNFSFVSDPIWSSEEQINRFLININKVYNKISFVNLATQANFIPIETTTNEIKQTINLERFNY